MVGALVGEISEDDAKRMIGEVMGSLAQYSVVAALLKSEVKYIPLEAIGKLCDYLLAKRLAKPQDLPGILFALEPENFWELIARRQWVEVCMGVRKDGAEDTLDDAWIVASDSVMFGELLRGITDFRLWAPKAAADAALLWMFPGLSLCSLHPEPSALRL